MLRATLRGDQSKTGIIQSKLDVKSWLHHPPSAEEARPSRCPRCSASSRRPGCGLGLWGHGLRERRVEGPLSPGEAAADLVFMARRFLCRSCGAVLMVVPRGILPWCRYTAATIALALALWGHGLLPVACVRRRMSTTPTPAGFGDPARWASLGRWVKATLRGELFLGIKVRRQGTKDTQRAIAGRIAVTLAAHGLPTLRHLSIEVQAFHGGAAMA